MFPSLQLAFEVLAESCQSLIWWLTTARRNLYQPVLVQIYHYCAITEVLLPFHDM